MRRFVWLTVVVLLGLVISLLLTAEPATEHVPAAVRPVGVQATTAPLPSPAPAEALVPWHGPVEELFFHPVVVHPRLAFTRDPLGRGFANYFVTAGELRGILDGLWRNGWTMVDVHRAAARTVRVPAGRRPFVLSEDDVNYYDYFAGRGLGSRLVLDNGVVKAEVDGAPSDDDLVPIVEEEVRAHPEFSADGAKGVLGLTAYQGLFGEHDLKDSAARLRVTAIVQALRASGWTMASHTYGHITLAKDSLRVIARDTARWHAAADELLGPVDVLIYPFGSRPSPAGARLLASAGFPTQLDIDVHPSWTRVDGIVRMSRRHVDGLAFDEPRRLAPFFDVAAIREPQGR